jgi:hypothetical protein
MRSLAGEVKKRIHRGDSEDAEKRTEKSQGKKCRRKRKGESVKFNA